MERDVYLQALARFTHLSADEATAETSAKDLDTIKMLILVAQKHGDFLGHSWLEMLRCVSKVEDTQVIGAGQQAKERRGGEGGGCRTSRNFSEGFDGEFMRWSSIVDWTLW